MLIQSIFSEMLESPFQREWAFDEEEDFEDEEPFEEEEPFDRPWQLRNQQWETLDESDPFQPPPTNRWMFEDEGPSEPEGSEPAPEPAWTFASAWNMFKDAATNIGTRFINAFQDVDEGLDMWSGEFVNYEPNFDKATREWYEMLAYVNSLNHPRAPVENAQRDPFDGLTREAYQERETAQQKKEKNRRKRQAKKARAQKKTEKNKRKKEHKLATKLALEKSKIEKSKAKGNTSKKTDKNKRKKEQKKRSKKAKILALKEDANYQESSVPAT